MFNVDEVIHEVACCAWWASTSSDDAVKGQGIGDTKGRSSRALRINGCLADGFGLLVPKDGSSSGVDMRGTTVCERVDHFDR